MDEQALKELIGRIPILKYRFLGIYSADESPPDIFDNSFIIVNTEKRGKDGHWILIARKNGKMYYGDSYGANISNYRNLRYSQAIPMIQRIQQRAKNSCGLFTIFYAWRLFQGFPVDSTFNDYELNAFFCKFI